MTGGDFMWECYKAGYEQGQHDGQGDVWMDEDQIWYAYGEWLATRLEARNELRNRDQGSARG